jgi:hypothetical protein
MGVCFHRGPDLGNMEGRPFLRNFEIKRYVKRYVKMPLRGYFHRDLFGEPGRDSLDGTF